MPKFKENRQFHIIDTYGEYKRIETKYKNNRKSSG